MNFDTVLPTDEMMRSQVQLMKAQQKAYLDNKELFDRFWAEAIPNDLMEVEKRSELQGLERFRAWCETC